MVAELGTQVCMAIKDLDPVAHMWYSGVAEIGNPKFPICLESTRRL